MSFRRARRFAPRLLAASVAMLTCVAAVISAARPAAAQPAARASTLAPGAGGFVPITPYRLVDTRVAGHPSTGNPTYGLPALTAKETRSFKVDIAAAGAVALNVTVVGATGPGFLAVWPGDKLQPTASAVNYSTGQTVPNAVTVQLAADGTIKVYSLAATDLLVDVMGYYTKTPSGPGGGGFQGVQPVRLLDSRDAWPGYSGPLTANTSRQLNVVSPASIPDNAVAVVLNVAVTADNVPSPSGGFLTVYPSGSAVPKASNLNYTGAAAVANQVTVQVGPGGTVDLYAFATTQVIVDVMGYFAAGATVPGGFVPLSPRRLMDTREIYPGQVAYDPVTDSFLLSVGGTTDSGIPVAAGAVSLNVTIVDPEAPGFVTVWPDGAAQPPASNLNHEANQTVPNAVTVGLGATHGISIYDPAVADAVVDANGWYTSPYA